MSRSARYVSIAMAMAIASLASWVTLCWAYVEAPLSFGKVVADSSNIVLMRVESVDKTKNLIIYRKVQDIKGKHPTDVIKHNIGTAGLRPNEWKPPMEWAEPGKTAVFFYNGGASETCIGNWWYQAYAGGEWWNHSHGEPFLLRSYAGAPDKLVGIVPQMMEGKEVVVPCMVDGNKEDLHLRRAKIQRLKASIKLQDYNPKRDFVGWGGEDFRRVLGMPGFTHVSSLPRVDPDAQSISCIDFDGDGKQDLCLAGGSRVALLQNNGEALGESYLTGIQGARSAVWADYNRDGKPDLLVATPNGLRLFTNLGGNFRDDSQLLPPEAMLGAHAGYWLDVDGDGRPDILAAHGYHGLRAYRNQPVANAKVEAGKEPALEFADVSKAVGLGTSGFGSDVKADALAVADLDGDGKPDVLYGNRVALLQGTKGTEKFVDVAKAGLTFTPSKSSPALGDFDHDGLVDLLVPGKGACKLYKNAGQGTFTEVTANTGDLAKFAGWATSATWGDFDHDGLPDLLVGCLRGPNRLYRQKSVGVFEDVSEAVGLTQKIYNSQAVQSVDVNGDGVLDLVFNNEGQESVILLASPPTGTRIPFVLTMAGKDSPIGCRVDVMNAEGKRVARQLISGGEGRGSQASPQARFILEPGQYKVQVQMSSGQVRERNVTVGQSPVREKLEDMPPKTQ